MAAVSLLPKAGIAIEEIAIYLAEQSQDVAIALTFLTRLENKMKQYAAGGERGQVQ